jgi:hypothetical protein
MKVKELIEQLEKMPQDLEVAVYSQMDEGDGLAKKVEIAHSDEYYQAKEYYCQGDSIPACVGLKEWVVIKGE